MQKLKAYSVQVEDAGVIVFASNDIAAKRLGANELNTEAEYIEMCRREPWADCYAEQGWVPAKDLLENDWYLECFNCSAQVSAYDDNEPIYRGAELYCSQVCRDSFEAQKKEARQRKEERSKIALSKWPGIELLYVSEHDRDARIEFRFPGSVGRVAWRVDEPFVSMCSADIPAWEKFVAGVVK